jgi:putative ABC transport system substrate-binding protein
VVETRVVRALNLWAGPFVGYPLEIGPPLFAQRLRELGWTKGRTVTIEYRWAEGRSERYAEIAAEFVRLKVDVILTAGGAVAALKQETSVIPIVFAIAVDPVGTGLVASLARPGGNVTDMAASRCVRCDKSSIRMSQIEGLPLSY